MPRTVQAPPRLARVVLQQLPARLLLPPVRPQVLARPHLARMLAPLRHRPRALHLLRVARLPHQVALSLVLSSPQLRR